MYDTHAEAVKDDVRFEHVKEAIDAGKIECMEDIFERLPKTVLSVAIGKKVDRFTTMTAQPDKFYVGDIRNMAILFNVSVFQMFGIVYNEPVHIVNIASD